MSNMTVNDDQETCGCGVRFPPEGTCGLCGQSAKSGPTKDEKARAQYHCTECGYSGNMPHSSCRQLMCEGCGKTLVLFPAHQDEILAWSKAFEWVSRRDVIEPDKAYGFRVPNVPALDPYLLKEKPKPDSENLQTCTFDKCIKNAVFNGYCEEHKHRYYFIEGDE